MFFAHSIHTFDKKYANIFNSGRHFIRYLYFKMFLYSFKSITEREGSWVIVAVSLLTKPTLSGLSVRTSGRPDCWTDAMAEVLSFSLLQFPRPDATSRRPQILARANDVSADPLNKRLVWRRQWETADGHNGVYLRSGSCAKKNWAARIKSLITVYINSDFHINIYIMIPYICWKFNWKTIL